jgi:hypothetical protein
MKSTATSSIQLIFITESFMQFSIALIIGLPFDCLSIVGNCGPWRNHFHLPFVNLSAKSREETPACGLERPDDRASQRWQLIWMGPASGITSRTIPSSAHIVWWPMIDDPE